jgi:hypothetical protein
LRLQRAVGQEAGTDKRNRLVEAGGRIVLDELDGAAAAKNA